MTFAELFNVVGFKVKDSDVKKVNSTFNTIRSTAQKVLGAIGVGISLANINAISEEFGRVNAQIASATSYLEDQYSVQQKILDAASLTRSTYQQTAGMISNLVKENSALFGSIDEAVAFNNAATMLFKSAGKSNEETAALMEAINKSFAKGRVDSETISQLLERAPEAVELLNKRLGSSSSQLEAMAADGRFTVEDLKAAFVENSAEIEKRFGRVKISITDALTVIRNKWGLWVADTNKGFGITSSVGTAMVKGFDIVVKGLNKARDMVLEFSDKVGGMENLFRVTAIAAGSIFLALNGGKVLGFFKTLGGVLSLSSIKVVGVVAALSFLGLIVEDIWGFFEGKGSLFGDALTRAGIDIEEFRATARQAWGDFKKTLADIGEMVTAAAIPIGKLFVDGTTKIMDGAVSLIQTLQAAPAWLEKNKDLLTLLGIAVGAFTAAVAANNIATKIMDLGGVSRIAWMAAMRVQMISHAAASGVAATATTAFGTAMAFLTSPITLTIAAIAALIAIIVLCVRHWDDIRAAGGKTWEWIQEAWAGAKDWFHSNVVQPVLELFNSLHEGITSTAGNIAASVVEGFQTAVDWITGLPAEAVTWGRDIIQAIVDGIKGAISLVGDAAASVADKIKSFLGFSEPEEGPLSNFHTYMPDMVDLMAQGIRGGKGKVKMALADLTADMQVMAQAKTVSHYTAAAAGAVSNRSVMVNQTNNFTNTFNGEKAIQQQAATTMDRSTEDATAQLARGLAYAR